MTIQITEEMNQLAEFFIQKIVFEKQKEKDYKYDNYNVLKRFKTGILGEMAIFQMLGYKYSDVETDVGSSSAYQHADLQTIGFFQTGIKTFSAENQYPIIYKKNTENQIICKVDDSEIEILGIATVDMLNDELNCSDEYILDPNLRGKGYKTAFVNFSALIPFTIDNLINLEGGL